MRPFSTDIAAIYLRARVLLVPHRIDNRPRVILEAQSRGIPVIASDWPGLAEAVGPGGVLIDRAAGVEAWQRALESLWEDEVLLERLAQAARTHAQRPEVDPSALVTRFIDLISSAAATHRDACACG